MTTGIVLDGSKSLIAKALGEKSHTLVLRNHGLLTAGENAWALTRHQAFIRNAEVQLGAMAAYPVNYIGGCHDQDTRTVRGGLAQAGAKVRHPEGRR